MRVSITGMMGGSVGPLVAWVEPGLTLFGFCVPDDRAVAWLGRLPSRLWRKRSANAEQWQYRGPRRHRDGQPRLP